MSKKATTKNGFPGSLLSFTGVAIMVGIIASALLVRPVDTRRVFSANAATYYVSASGSDSNNGSPSAPFKTFAKAQAVASFGDTVRFLPGTYVGKIHITKSGLSVLGEQTVVDGAGQHEAIYVQANDTTLRGFEAIHSTSHVVRVEAERVTLSDLYIHDGIYENRTSSGYAAHSGWGSGLKISWPSKAITVDKVRIHNVYGEALDIYGVDGVTVTNSVVSDSYSIGFYIDNSKNITMERNFAYCSGDPRFKRANGTVMAGFSMALERLERWIPQSNWGAQLKHIRIVNNISYGCSGMSMWGSEHASGATDNGLIDATIAHNSIFAVHGGGVSIWIKSLPANADIEIFNNLTQSGIDSPTGTTQFGNITGVPFTTDQYTQPTTIKPTNGKDKGIASDISVDFSGAARDSRPDAGAWEIGASGAPIAPPQTQAPRVQPPTAQGTATPTKTPTARPSPPKAAGEVRPSTPSKMSTPGGNKAPVIKTNWLGLHALSGKLYNSRFFAVDRNMGDRLSMSVTGLPAGISLGACETQNWHTELGLICSVKGTSTKRGKYPVRIQVTDSKGGVTTKTVTFRVW